MKRKILSLMMGLILISMSSIPAQAYSLGPFKWRHTAGTTLNVSYKFGTNITFAWDTAFRTGISDWNNTPTKVNFYQSSTSKNVLNVYSDPYGGYGKCDIYPDSSGYISYFIAGGNTATTSGFTSTARRSTAGHELGHSVGLGHTLSTALMNDVRNRDSIYTPKTDDINGVNAMYK